MLNYTKGEWEVMYDSVHGYSIGNGEVTLATLTTLLEEQANARLIAAAPELYEALKQIQRWLLEGTEIEGGKAKLFNTQFVKANNLTVRAIAKVEGGK